MKKLLFIGMMCVMSVSTFAKETMSSNTCNLHYTRVVLNPQGGLEGVISFSIQGSTCSAALERAREYADVMEQLI